MTDPNVPSETPQTPPAASVPPAAPVAAGPKQALSLTSFITGLASVVFCWVPVLGFLASIAAIVLGFIGKAKEPGAPKWMWLIGIIAGFVGIVLGFLVLVLPLILFASLMASVPNISY
jgi:hypothetical protein